MKRMVSVWTWTTDPMEAATTFAMVVFPLPGMPQKIRRRPFLFVDPISAHVVLSDWHPKGVIL